MRTFVIVGLFFAALLATTAAQSQTSQDSGKTLLTLPPGEAVKRPARAPVALSAVPEAARKPQILNFDVPIRAPWEIYSCTGTSRPTYYHGILAVASPRDCLEFLLWPGPNVWHSYVSNTRGWVIEAALRVISGSPSCGLAGTQQVWANDYTNLIIVGFDPREVCISYPDYVSYKLDTTAGYHVYRIESKGNRVRVFVNGILRIDHTLTWPGGGSEVLNFGDGVGGDSSLVKWDYFSYDVFPKNLSIR